MSFGDRSRQFTEQREAAASFGTFLAEQQKRIEKKLAVETITEKERRRTERPTRNEIVRFGTTTCRGITTHATGERKRGNGSY